MINKGDMIAGRYLIIDTLGEGGMANVYLAEDTYLHRQVALKSLRYGLKNDKETRERFKREAQAMTELSSPNIVNILDVGEDHNNPFFIMEYVDGMSLKEYIRKNFPIPYQQVVDFMEEIISGVKVAHDHGIIHRDLKPQNILITNDNHAKVTDFGIALSPGEQSITSTNSTIGSVHYMAPERVRGSKATVQSDIYALGIILFEMLTGKVPFDGDTTVSIAMKHFREEIPSLRDFDPRISQALENVVLKATSKKPSDRYPNVEAMGQDLKTSLLSSRAKEPKFIPASLKNDDNLEETKVISTIDRPTMNANNQKSKSKKKKPWYTRKIFYILTGFLAVLIVIAIVFMLDFKKTVAVPDTGNLTQSQAKAVLQNSKLNVGRISTQHSDSVDNKHVIRSIPKIGSKIKSGSSVKLVISSGPALRRMPDLKNKSYAASKKKLKKMGFEVKRLNRYSTSVAPGNIISQNLKADKKYNPQKHVVRLKVSLGEKDQKFTIRDLSGYNLKSVEDYADDHGLELAVKQEHSDSVQSGLVISQDPADGTVVDRGTSLTVIISSGKETSSASNKNTSKNNESGSSHNSNNSNDSDNQKRNTTESINIPFDGQDDKKSNSVQIYVQDSDHNLNNVYKSMSISNDTEVSIPFTLSKGQTGKYRIVRDGQEISNQTVGN